MGAQVQCRQAFMLSLLVNLMGPLIALLQRIAPNNLFFYPVLALISMAYVVIQWEVNDVQKKVADLQLKLQECERVHANITRS